MAALGAISPFFLVRDIGDAVAFYRDALGFEPAHASPEPEPFFAIVARDGASIFLKAVAPDVAPLPNVARHPGPGGMPMFRWRTRMRSPQSSRRATCNSASRCRTARTR